MEFGPDSASLPLPPRPGASRASVSVGGWISVACQGASLNSLADVYLSHCEVGLGLSLEGAGGKGCALNLIRAFRGQSHAGAAGGLAPPCDSGWVLWLSVCASPSDETGTVACPAG